MTAFVGRDRELDLLEHSFESMGSGVQVLDIVGEPGIGKTRLLHEFRAHAAQRRAWMLAGVCTPDGQQTPFRIFIDIIRSDFRVALGDEAGTVESKLDEGLRALGLSSEQNFGLLLNRSAVRRRGARSLVWTAC